MEPTETKRKLLWVILAFATVFWVGGLAGLLLDEFVHPTAQFIELGGAYLVGGFGSLFVASALVA